MGASLIELVETESGYAIRYDAPAFLVGQPQQTVPCVAITLLQPQQPQLPQRQQSQQQ